MNDARDAPNPCPSCGPSMVVMARPLRRNPGRLYFGWCRKCHRTGPIIWGRIAAINAWNASTAQRNQPIGKSE